MSVPGIGGRNMAHSSGGGSSGGGSHSGGGGRGGSANTKFGSRYYPGSHRYVYYVGGRPRYYFSDEPYTTKTAREQKRGRILSGILTGGGALIFFIISLMASFHIFGRVETDYDTTVVIEDSAGILTGEDEEELRASFDSFLDLTGVTPAFVSIKEAEWKGAYSTLEVYALKTYYNMFPDEKHWLFVYSDGGDRETWGWEGIIGDDCESAITEAQEEELTEKIQQNLWASSRYSVGGAIAAALDQLSQTVTKTTFDSEMGFMLIMLAGLSVYGIYMLITGIKMDPENDPKVQSSRCTTDSDKPSEDTCEYCGGVYVHGIHYNCPHCGAPIKVEKGEAYG